jgi:multisubunit Na+/H+ antiporter MnhC subunit
MAQGAYKTEAALQAVVVAAIAVAVAASAMTCTIAVNAYSTQDVNNVMRILSDSNFICTNSGNNLVIVW